MPKRHQALRTGHLIKGDVEYTVVKECSYFSSGGRIHSNEYKVSTFTTVEEAADCAKKCWVKSPSPMETYKVYEHTKGKTAYSPGHFRQINWPDYDYTSKKRSTNRELQTP